MPPPSLVQRIPAITRTVARSLSLDAIEVYWETAGVVDLMTDYQFYVQRSESDDGPWVTISPALIDEYFFIDQGIKKLHGHRIYYYRVRVERIDDTSIALEGAPVAQTHYPDLFLNEIQKRERLLLKRFVGTWCAVFIRKTFGQRCGCWDDKLKRHGRGSNRCRDCYFTGFVGGYMTQINTYIHVRPFPLITGVKELGEEQPDQADTWLSNSPLLKPKDIIVDPRTNERWRITGGQVTTRRRTVSRQIINIVEIERGDVEWDIPVVETPEPYDSFIGFYPLRTPGIYDGNADKPEGSGLL